MSYLWSKFNYFLDRLINYIMFWSVGFLMYYGYNHFAYLRFQFHSLNKYLWL